MSHRYCGRDFHAEELALIRRLIAEDPSRTRAELARLTCQALDWRKADGGYKAMSARVAMLRMHEQGLIALPPPRGKRPDSRVRIAARSDPRPPIEKPAGVLTPLILHRVQDKSHSRLYNEYIERYHCLLATSPCQERSCVTSSTGPRSHSPCSALVRAPGCALRAMVISAGPTSSGGAIST